MFYSYLYKRLGSGFFETLGLVIPALLILILVILAVPTLAGATDYERLTRLQWQQDLESLDTDIRQYHINPFWFRNESGYKRLYKEAHNYIAKSEKLDPNRVNGYFEKLVAYIADGHSYVMNKAARFGAFSYSLEWFDNNLHVVSVEQGDNNFLGAKVLAFDGMSIEQANKHIAPYIPVVNSSAFKFHSKDAYQFAGLLKDAGISKSSQSIELTLALKDGQQVKKVFGLRKNNIESIDLGEFAGAAVPLYHQQLDKNQWFVFLEKEHVVYFRYALVIEKTAGDMSRITAELVQFLNAHDVQKLIVDVRDNGGGDSFFNAPLINAIAKNVAINQRSALFVLTNHNTFSAAINFAGNMEIKTRAIFVGEKVADRATFAGEAGTQARHSLPNSGVVISLSFSEWNSTYINDQRDSVSLDIPVALTMRDFIAGYDPVLQACLDYPAQKLPEPVIDETKYANWIGRYDYSPDKALKIFTVSGRLKLEITEQVFSNLYPATKQHLKTDLAAIELALLPNGDVEFFQSGSQKSVLHRLADNQLKPLELLMTGQFEAAKIAYQKIHRDNPKLLSIRGNSLGILASHIRARYGDSKYYDQLRDIAISLYGEPIPSWDSNE